MNPSTFNGVPTIKIISAKDLSKDTKMSNEKSKLQICL